MDTYFLDLYLTTTSGSLDIVGKLQLFCWLRAVKGPSLESRGHLTVVVASEADGGLVTRESDGEMDRVEALVTALDELHFPERPLQVEEVFDTADFWEHVVFRVTLNDATATLGLGLCASGFEGDDADGLREVFRKLLGMAGVLDQKRWFNLIGPSSS